MFKETILNAFIAFIILNVSINKQSISFIIMFLFLKKLQIIDYPNDVSMYIKVYHEISMVPMNKIRMLRKIQMYIGRI